MAMSFWFASCVNQVLVWVARALVELGFGHFNIPRQYKQGGMFIRRGRTGFGSGR